MIKSFHFYFISRVEYSGYELSSSLEGVGSHVLQYLIVVPVQNVEKNSTRGLVIEHR